MESVTVKNFRCFREEQTARLAPLTLLVGENSTGKTSFLALLRALWDVAFLEAAPDFKQPPYDLGSFREIAHNRGSRSPKADSFEAGFEHHLPRIRGPVRFKAVFKERQGVPFPVSRFIAEKDLWLEMDFSKDEDAVLRFGTQTKEWDHRLDGSFVRTRDDAQLVGLSNLLRLPRITTEDGRQPLDNEALEVLEKLRAIVPGPDLTGRQKYPYAGAPVRSHPKRTYDPARPYRDPEGEYIPTYLANMSRQDFAKWEALKGRLEEFGKQSGLFDEINIDSLGKAIGSPFQVRIRKYGKKSKGLARNLTDVGYGVSQVLPLITELLDPDLPPLFLVQQPEVHLHPSAQAALGTLFCEIASTDRQLVVETHSDNIIDRVLIDVRDQKTDLRAKDVSILYFEPNDHDVTIHSLRLDEQGNILDAPDGYRQFFTDELRRVLGI